MADSLFILLALQLLDDNEVEISEVLDEDDDITLFSVGSSYMRRNLNRVRDYFEGTIPLYFPDECRVTSEFSHYLRSLPWFRCKSGAKENSSHLSHNTKRNTDIEQKNWKPC